MVCRLFLATADEGQHIWRLIPHRAPRPAAASPRGAGEAAPEESQQPRGGEKHAVQCHCSIQAEDWEHTERPGGQDQWIGERSGNPICLSVCLSHCFLLQEVEILSLQSSSSCLSPRGPTTCMDVSPRASLRCMLLQSLCGSSPVPVLELERPFPMVHQAKRMRSCWSNGAITQSSCSSMIGQEKCFFFQIYFPKADKVAVFHLTNPAAVINMFWFRVQGGPVAFRGTWWEVAPYLHHMDHTGRPMGSLPGRFKEGKRGQPGSLAPHQSRGSHHPGSGAGTAVQSPHKKPFT